LKTVKIEDLSNRESVTVQPPPTNLFADLSKHTKTQRNGKCRRCCTDYCSKSLGNAVTF
jgi:hypothetical protein